jgi:hypothetical protein
MEPSKHRDCFNAALCLERTWNRLLLRKCLVRARLIVESHVFDEDAPKMVLTEDEDMVEHLSAKRARKALGEGIHVRRARIAVRTRRTPDAVNTPAKRPPSFELGASAATRLLRHSNWAGCDRRAL